MSVFMRMVVLMAFLGATAGQAQGAVSATAGAPPVAHQSEQDTTATTSETTTTGVVQGEEEPDCD